MSDEIRIENLRHRCFFLSRSTIKLALIRSYIADITLVNDEGSLTLFGLPAALFLLNTIEECALSPIKGEGKTSWPMPETDENLLIWTKGNVLHIEAPANGVNWCGTRIYRVQRENGLRLLYDNLKKLISPDKSAFEEIGPIIIDNPVIRHIFEYRYI